MFKKILNLLNQLVFGTIIEPKKDDLVKKIDADTERTDSAWVKNRNQIEKDLLNIINEKQASQVIDLLSDKLNKK